MTENGPYRRDVGVTEPVSSQANLETKINYTFKNFNLLKQALTHSSAASHRRLSNERLEFLGDRVLGLIVADMLLTEFPNEDEGALGYRFAALVRRESLEQVADQLGFETHIKREIDPAEMSDRQRSSLLANACEAVIAAIYLDGGLASADAFIRCHWMQLLKQDLTPPKDAKTRLQEYAQGQGWNLPVYEITGQSGPDHAPEFTIEVTVHNHPPVQGGGRSKRAAETHAAEALYLQLTGKSENG